MIWLWGLKFKIPHYNIDFFCKRSSEAASLCHSSREQTPLAKTARTCEQILKIEPALWKFVEVNAVEPTNNTAERALRTAVIWRDLSYGSWSRD